MQKLAALALTRAIVLSPRDFEWCHHTSLLAQSQSGVAVNCSNAMDGEKGEENVTTAHVRFGSKADISNSQ